MSGLNSLDITQIDDWVFDLDNTIYPASASLFPRVAARMTEFIMQQFAIDEAEAAAMKSRLFRQYGTTMHGLMKEHDMAPEAFLAYVHEIDLSDVSADRDLDSYLSGLPGRKHIYTNGTVRHAERILDAFGISRHFDVIFDIVASAHVPKPDPRPYQTFLQTGAIDPTRAVMIEDMARNLEPAAALGMRTVWLSSAHDWARQGAEKDYVHFVADDLKAFLAGLSYGKES